MRLLAITKALLKLVPVILGSFLFLSSQSYPQFPIIAVRDGASTSLSSGPGSIPVQERWSLFNSSSHLFDKVEPFLLYMQGSRSSDDELTDHRGSRIAVDLVTMR
jgi:hypothetical protein